MLILSRKRGEKIIIGDDIIIHVLPRHKKSKSHNEVRLGISAPEGVTIHRSEVYDRIKSNESEVT